VGPPAGRVDERDERSLGRQMTAAASRTLTAPGEFSVKYAIGGFPPGRLASPRA
jgi:hypothetical protein